MNRELLRKVTGLPFFLAGLAMLLGASLMLLAAAPSAQAQTNPVVELTISNSQPKIYERVTVTARLRNANARVLTVGLAAPSNSFNDKVDKSVENSNQVSSTFLATQIGRFKLVAVADLSDPSKPDGFADTPPVLAESVYFDVQPDWSKVKALSLGRYIDSDGVPLFHSTVKFPRVVDVYAVTNTDTKYEITGTAGLTFEVQNERGGPTSDFSVTQSGTVGFNRAETTGKLIVRWGNLKAEARLYSFETTIGSDGLPMEPAPAPVEPLIPPVSQPIVLVLDNPDGSRQGTWYIGYESSAIQYVGRDYLMHDPVVAGVGSSDWFRWQVPASAPAGQYDIEVSWQAKDNRARNAAYSLIKSGQAQPLALGLVDQRTPAPGGWQRLSRNDLVPGDWVQVSSSSTGKVVADAVRLTLVSAASTPGPSPLPPTLPTTPTEGRVVDDANGNAQGNWYPGWESSDIQYIGGSYRLHDPVAAGTTSADRFVWTVPAAGNYTVYARWQAKANRASDALYSIRGISGVVEARRDQRTQGGVWVQIATYRFAAGEQVVLQPTASGKVVADALLFVPVAESSASRASSGQR